MKLSASLSTVLEPLFLALPLERAMPELVPAKVTQSEFIDLVAAIQDEPQIQANPAIQAALWLYVDDLDRSHEISQNIKSPLGGLWHGIMHRREGDFWNSKYWFRRAGGTRALGSMDPCDFVDRVEKAAGQNPPELLSYQRQEWQTLFEWSAKEAAL
jgi:hypothetical protein